MKLNKLTSAILLGAMAACTVAQAQGSPDVYRDRNGDLRVMRPGDVQRREDRREEGRQYHRDDRGDYYRYDRDGRGGRAMGNRGPDEYRYGYARQWHRGDRIPPEYRNRQYVVDDWRAHRLHVPPRGYHWVQVGGDYVLVAIATGIIAELAFSQ